MKTLVTGSASFAGSYFVDVLLSRRYEVIGLDNLLTEIIRYLEDVNKSRMEANTYNWRFHREKTKWLSENK